MSSNSGPIQMTADANDIQAKSIYHGAKKKKKSSFSVITQTWSFKSAWQLSFC